MLENIRELQRHLSLKQMVIDLFVPPAEKDRVCHSASTNVPRTGCIAGLILDTHRHRVSVFVLCIAMQIESRASWDEERSEWVLEPVNFTPLYAHMGGMNCSCH
jgi:hypothetical protein